MKSVLVLAIIAVVVCAAAAATTCANTLATCKGPVQKVYSGNSCSGTVNYRQYIADSSKVTGGKCYKRDDNGNAYSGSFKLSCGTSLVQRGWTTQDCSGPYSIISSPTKKCFKSDNANGGSYEYLCASASTVSASVLLLIAMAILAILNL